MENNQTELRLQPVEAVIHSQPEKDGVGDEESSSEYDDEEEEEEEDE